MTSMLDRISNIVVSTYNQMYPEEAESARERGQRIRRAEERVIQEKPAYKKWIQKLKEKGDIVIKLGDSTVVDIYAYMRALSVFDKGDSTKLIVIFFEYLS